jgi:hypothetical protein
MTAPKIETPQGSIVIGENGKAQLTFSTSFVPKWQGHYTDAQKFVDSEVLRLSEPYVPLLTGMLIQSGILGSDIGSGMVQWIAPYSRAQYYGSRAPGSLTGPLRGPQWFERMKAVSKETIIKGAKQIAGQGKT